MSDAPSSPDPAPTADSPPPTSSRTALLIGALGSAGAGLVHAAAAGSHNTDRGLALLFAVVAAVQLGWAALAVVRPGRQVATAGVVLGVIAVGAWGASRTVGIPLPLFDGVEAAGTQDLLATVLGAVGLAGAAAALLLGPVARDLPRNALVPLGVTAALVTALAVPGMAAPHEHGAGHAHEDGAAESEHAHVPGMEHGPGHDDHGDGHAAHASAGHAGAGHGERRITSIDDPRLTEGQRRKALDLLSNTFAGMIGLKLTDEASVIAAGYETIADSSSGFEHFINHTYLHDGKELDPNRIEAVVFETKPGQPKKLAAAMYILEEPKRMADAPDIAGSLTTWHLHADLCWDPSGKRVIGVQRQGRCIPAGQLAETPPMLHVWLGPHPCGPFAEAEVDNPIDRALNRGSTTTRAPGADPCQHEHNGTAH